MNNNLNNYNNIPQNNNNNINNSNNGYPTPPIQNNNFQSANINPQNQVYQNQAYINQSNNNYQSNGYTSQQVNVSNPSISISNQVNNYNEEPVNNITNEVNNITSTQSNNLINELNVDGSYNNIEKQDIEPINNNETKTKKTVTINKELKTLMIIVAILLVFITIMPSIFDFFRNLSS